MAFTPEEEAEILGLFTKAAKKVREDEAAELAALEAGKDKPSDQPDTTPKRTLAQRILGIG